jgi:menaquinone-dependent protoporphyrinogen IX oxidase
MVDINQIHFWYSAHVEIVRRDRSKAFRRKSPHARFSYCNRNVLIIVVIYKLDIMNEKILIAYASKSNATSDYAGFIAGEMTARGYSVDQINLRETRKLDIKQYKVVLIGTGIRIGRWYGPARKMLKMKEMKEKKLAVFISCSTAMDQKKRAEAITNYIDPILKKYNLDACSKAAFPGRMPGSKEEMAIETDTLKSWVDRIVEDCVN